MKTTGSLRWTWTLIGSGVAYGLALGVLALLHVTSYWSLLPLGSIFAVMVFAGKRSGRELDARTAERLRLAELAEVRWAAEKNIVTTAETKHTVSKPIP